MLGKFRERKTQKEGIMLRRTEKAVNLRSTMHQYKKIRSVYTVGYMFTKRRMECFMTVTGEARGGSTQLARCSGELLNYF